MVVVVVVGVVQADCCVRARVHVFAYARAPARACVGRLVKGETRAKAAAHRHFVRSYLRRCGERAAD